MSVEGVADNPTEAWPKPPFPEQDQAHPGLESKMTPEPDYGEQTYRGFGRLEGKVALITGGDSGIGRAVALAFAREGADVLISYLNEDDGRRGDAARRRGRRPQGASPSPATSREEPHCRQLVERTVREFGRLDILVNNAAYQMTRESIEEISAEEWEHTFRTNIFAMFYLCKAALPHMQPGGAIINVASIQAYQPSAQAAGLRDHQGRDRHLLQGAGRGGRSSRASASTSSRPVRSGRRSSRRRCREEKVRDLRPGHAAGAPGPAGGAGPELRLPGLERVELHHRRGHRRHRRQAAGVGRAGGQAGSHS